ncbi:hypothetical protein EDD21DRAFT_372482 [Dissophora ornata]|nr:hypothetical protein EDD21DRAFT_372482 [Dissophora ornata]
MVSRPRQTAELKQEPAPRRVIPQPKVHSQRPISPMQSTELKQDSIASKSVPQPRPGHNVRSTSPKLAFELNQESARAKIPQPKIPQPKIPQPKIPQPKINTQRPASPTQAQEQKQESTVAKTVSQLPQSKANNQRVAAQKTPEPKQEPLRVKIQPIPKVANQRTPGSLQPTEVKQESTRTAGFPQSKVGSLRSVKLEAPAPATPTTPGSARAPGGVSALKNMFETSTRPTKPQASVVVPTGVSARRKLFEASQRSVRPEAPKLATAPAPTPAPAPAPALTPVPAPAPVPAPVKKVIKVLSVPEKKRANESTEGLQLLEVESDNDTLEEGDVKEHAINVKKDIAIDEEAAELRELLKSMTAEEREEFLRLSHEDALPASTVVVAGH